MTDVSATSPWPYSALNRPRMTFWRVALLIVLLVGAVVGARFVSAILIKPTLLDLRQHPFGFGLEAYQLAGFGVGFLLLLLAFVVIFALVHQRNPSVLLSQARTFRVREFGLGLLSWGIVTTALWFGFEREVSEFFSARTWPVLIVVATLALLPQVLFEEIVFRGYLLHLGRSLIRRPALLALAIGCLFGLLHFTYGIAGVTNAAIFGVFFTLISIQRAGIEFSIGAHYINNLLQTLWFGSILDTTDDPSSSFQFDLVFIVTLATYALIAFGAIVSSGRRWQDLFQVQSREH